MRRVLLLNTGTGRNLGDRAMLVNVVRIARDEFPDAALTVSADVPEWIAREFKLERAATLAHVWGRWPILARKMRLPSAISKTAAPAYRVASSLLCLALTLLPRSLRQRLPAMEGEFARVAADASLVYFSGGGYLTDAGLLEGRALLWTALIARARGAAIVMTGQGVGPFYTALTQWQMRRIVAAAALVITREAIAVNRWFQAWRVAPGKWRSGVDDACSLPTAPRTPERDRAILALHWRESPFHPESRAVSSALVDIARVHLEAGYRVRLFVFHEAEHTERALYQSWIRTLGGDAVQIVMADDPRVLRAELAACDRAIGGAYHFLLFALMAGMPAAGVYSGDYYRAKFAGLAALFGRPECMVDSSVLDATTVVGLLDAMDAAGDRHERAAAAIRLRLECDEQIRTALRFAQEAG